MSKKNLFLGGILISLTLFAYIYSGPMKTWQGNKDKVDNFLKGVDLEQIDKIVIKSKTQETILEKAEDKWKIGGTKDFYAPSDIMSNLMDSLKKAQEGEMKLISTNKDKKSEFKIDDSGINLKLQRGNDVLKEVIVGGVASDFKNNYIAEKDNDKTYSVPVVLNIFNRNDWYDKTIFKDAQEKINKIRFQYPNKEFVIEKKDGQWSGISPYKFKVSEEKIQDILGIMSKLEAVKIPEQSFENTGLEKNSIIIEASGDNLNNVLMVGDINNEEDKYYYAKKGNSDNIYLITEEQRDDLKKNIWELK